jgi:hypothetical protein
MDLFGTIDPFVEIELSKNMTLYSSQSQTTVKHSSPYTALWDESFVLGIFVPQALRICLLDWDYTGSETVGEVVFSSEEIRILIENKVGYVQMFKRQVSKKGIPVVGHDKSICTMELKMKVTNVESPDKPGPENPQVLVFE